ncbi:MAG: RNA polymerase subunit sigma-70 [Longimicrobiales bacterium]
MTGFTETGALAAAVRAGDEAAFSELVERHRVALQVHCYRMLGSLHDAEDVVQETFMRAWRYRASLEEGAPLGPWLYRIATNACLDAIARDRRRAAVSFASAETAPGAAPPDVSEVSWLQPFPDTMLEPVAPREAEPDAIVVTKETIELAFLTVIQLLTPQQRAALILRDVLGWSAKETAELLETSVASVTSALQRARATLRKHLPPRKPEWPVGVDATAAERELLRRYIEASETPDLSGFASIIREDAVFRMPPDPRISVGRAEMIRFWVEGGFGTSELGQPRCVVTRANRQPAVANYVLKPGDTLYRAMALDVLRIEDGLIAEIVAFPPEVFDSFGLPPTVEVGAWETVFGYTSPLQERDRDK